MQPSSLVTFPNCSVNHLPITIVPLLIDALLQFFHRLYLVLVNMVLQDCFYKIYTEIFWQICQWQNFENRSTFAKVMTKNKKHLFFNGTQCISDLSKTMSSAILQRFASKLKLSYSINQSLIEHSCACWMTNGHSHTEKWSFEFFQLFNLYYLRK